jgi:hypothetical protein
MAAAICSGVFIFYSHSVFHTVESFVMNERQRSRTSHYLNNGPTAAAHIANHIIG